MKTTTGLKIAGADVKQKIFSVHSVVHTISTLCPQVIHNAAGADAPRDHFEISGASNFRSTHARFNLSNKKFFAVSMMRAGRKK